MRNRLVLLAFVLLLAAVPLLAIEPVFANDGVAIDGYDAVAYFTDSKPMEGSAEHAFEWNGAKWHFASEAHRAAFAENPARYAPQYGGYCAFGVSRGYAVKVDPTAWKVVDGKLYLNYNHDVQAEWAKDVAGYIAKADANWPAVLSAK
jgi:YHS domain-containing protein